MRLSRYPTITVAILTTNKPKYLDYFLDWIITITSYPDYEVLIVASDDVDQDVRSVIERFRARHETTIRFMTAATSTLGYARCANAAAANNANEFILFLNDNVRITRSDWLNLLVSHALRDVIGAVGPQLLSLTGVIEHFGIVFGFEGVESGPEDCASSEQGSTLKPFSVSRIVAGLSSSCLLVRTADSIAAGGFDDSLGDRRSADLDFCSRLRQTSGKRSLCLSDLTMTQV